MLFPVDVIWLSKNIHIVENLCKCRAVCNSEPFLVVFYDMTVQPLEHPEQDQDVLIQEPAKVILFNDEVHTFDEVIGQLIKATGCTAAKAESLAWEVHNNGRAVVFAGELVRCMEVSSTLEEIQLMTQVEV